jgi:hypothetical protein
MTRIILLLKSNYDLQLFISIFGNATFISKLSHKIINLLMFKELNTMKKHLLLSLLSALLISSLPFQSFATHYMGGEITWECIPTGQANAGKFIFQMRVYRECAGIQFGTTQTLSSTSPVGSISMTEVTGWPKDISPDCSSNPNFSHITCAGASTPNTGAIEEHLYRSAPIQINGVPPANGWMFYWGSCCRNPATNIVSANNKSWRLRAIMYPLGGSFNTYPCFDNSPAFAEAPQTIVCAGYMSSFNYYGWDNDHDSLVYEWGQPLESTGTPLSPYASGYSYTNPFPDTSKNINNIPATVNSHTGRINFRSFTTGAFVTSMKVTAYKSGIKISETWRDIQITVANCGMNTKPSIIAKLPNGTPITDTIFAHAGDTVVFNVKANSSQLLPNGDSKVLSMYIYGSQFGSYIPANGSVAASLDPNTGCTQPPCATLSPASGPGAPYFDTTNLQTQFRWVTDCGHSHVNTCCGYYFNTFRFSFAVRDDFCPVPGTNATSVLVKVLQKRAPSVKMRYIRYNYVLMTVDFGWKKFLDVDSNFISYDIFYAPNYNGPYTLIDSISNRHQIVYSHNIGTATKAYYYMKLRAYACNKKDFSINSDTLSIDITSIENTPTQTQLELFQSEPNPTNGKTKIRYSIDKRAKGSFQLLDFTGRIVMEKDLQSDYGSNEIVLETKSFAEGVYYYRVVFGNISRTKKLIIVK